MPFGALSPLPLRLGGSAEEGWTAEQHARFCADMQAIKRVAPLASWRYSVTTTEATVLAYVGQNGSGLAYAPTPTRNGNGDVSFAWASQYFEDEYGVQHPFKVRVVRAKGDGAGASVNAVWTTIANGVRVRRFTSAGAAFNGTGYVTVW
jgi:hypothetical protein